MLTNAKIWVFVNNAMYCLSEKGLLFIYFSDSAHEPEYNCNKLEYTQHKYNTWGVGVNKNCYPLKKVSQMCSTLF